MESTPSFSRAPLTGTPDCVLVLTDNPRFSFRVYFSISKASLVSYYFASAQALCYPSLSTSMSCLEISYWNPPIASTLFAFRNNHRLPACDLGSALR